jgi:hypothetical protein
MAIQMYNKQGDSIIVDNQNVQQHLKMGWTFQKPSKPEKPKSKSKTKKVKDEIETVYNQPSEEPAESTLVLDAEATAEVIKPNKPKGELNNGN